VRHGVQQQLQRQHQQHQQGGISIAAAGAGAAAVFLFVPPWFTRTNSPPAHHPLPIPIILQRSSSVPAPWC
jgi:hypothetical protein